MSFLSDIPTDQLTSEKCLEMCREAIRQNGDAIYRVPKDLRTPEMYLESIKAGFTLRWVPEHLRTLEMCLEAVKKNGNALQWVPEHLRTFEMCLEAVKKDRHALEHVPKNLKKDVLSNE